MDLRIRITDEDDEVRDYLVVYQDGSDIEGTSKIRAFIETEFDVECSICNDPGLPLTDTRCESCNQLYENSEPCRYCGGTCPINGDDFVCDGFGGNIDGLYMENELA